MPVPKATKTGTTLRPISFFNWKHHMIMESWKYLRLLFDSGAHKTMTYHRCVPEGVKPLVLWEKKSFNILSGQLMATEKVWLQDIPLPEFDKNRIID